VSAMELLHVRDGSTRIAVVGASNAPEKYGNIITRDLTRKGYTVLPIHPRERRVAGLTAYPTVDAAPGPVHIVNFVVPPAVSREVLATLDPARYEVVWFQPGSYDAEAVRDARARFREVVVEDCIMVVAGWA
jgi:predicted CoA-binding protein